MGRGGRQGAIVANLSERQGGSQIAAQVTELARETNPHSAIDKQLGTSTNQESGLTVFSDGTKVVSDIRLEGQIIHLNYIHSLSADGQPLEGAGIGTRVLRALENWADITRKTIVLQGVTNEAYFEKMGYEPKGPSTLLPGSMDYERLPSEP